MRMTIGLLAILSVGALSQAVAAEPPATPSSSTTTTPAATSTTSSTEASASKTTTAAPTSSNGSKPVNLVAGDAQAEARLKRLRAAGYRPEMRNKQVVFCRKEQALGSRFDKKICNTAEALDEQLAQGQNLIENSQRMGLGAGNPHGS